MTLSDALSCGITYDRHSDDSRGVIYYRNIFQMLATGDYQINNVYNSSLLSSKTFIHGCLLNTTTILTKTLLITHFTYKLLFL